MRVLITGCSSGIGKFLAGHLLEAGHSVWGVARRDQFSWERQYRGSFFSSKCDVSDWEQVQRTAQEVDAAWKGLDAFIACAGIQGSIGPSMTIPPQEWVQTVHTNLNGTYFSVRGLYSLLLRSNRRGKVILLSGGGATGPRPNFSAYAAAKTAIVRLTEVLAKEWERESIDINSVAPGALYTAMTEEVINLGPDRAGVEEYETALKVKNGGGGSLKKVAALTDFLLSEKSDGISGRLIAAQWDNWDRFDSEAMGPHLLTLRRLT